MPGCRSRISPIAGRRDGLTVAASAKRHQLGCFRRQYNSPRPSRARPTPASHTDGQSRTTGRDHFIPASSGVAATGFEFVASDRLVQARSFYLIAAVLLSGRDVLLPPDGASGTQPPLAGNLFISRLRTFFPLRYWVVEVSVLLLIRSRKFLN